MFLCFFFFFFSSRRRHTRSFGDWSSDVCSSDLAQFPVQIAIHDGSDFLAIHVKIPCPEDRREIASTVHERGPGGTSRDSDMLIGCIRVVPLRNVRRCLTESLLQDRPFEQLLTWLGNGRDRVGEVGRWVVAPEYAPFRMGLRLAIAAGGLAKQLGLETIIAMVGTRDGQARTLMRAGGQRVPGFASVRSSDV